MLKKVLFPAIALILLSLPLVSSADSCITLTRTLSVGSRGDDVTALQQFLVSQNLLSSESTSGYFGPLTLAALKKFQCNQGLVCNGTPATTGWGVVGPKTRATIRTISCGTTPPPPRKVSCTLSADNPTVYPDESATISWTSHNATGGILTPGIGSVGPSGSQTIPNLQYTTTFNGLFQGENGNATCNTTVTVVGAPAGNTGAPAINTFSASPITITAGQATLSWQATGASSFTLSDNNVTWSVTGTS